MGIDKLNILSGALDVNGSPTDRELWNYVCGYLRRTASVGEVGYKIPSLGVSDPDEIPAIVAVTKQHGLLVFDVVDRKVESISEDGLWHTENGKIIRSRDITSEFYLDEVTKRFKRSHLPYDRKSKKILVSIRTAVIFRDNTKEEIESIFHDESLFFDCIITKENIDKRIEEFISSSASVDMIADDAFNRAVGLLDGTDSYEDKASELSTKDPKTVNDFIQHSLHKVFRQDDQQRQISMQVPNGPQRIRGLAGTGKTIVLSLKAAISHFSFPEFKILFLFNTQSLYNHINGLIDRYYIPEAKKSPNRDFLHVRHAWGAKDRPGLYSDLCDMYGIRRLTLDDVRGSKDGLAAVYRDLLKKCGDKLEPIYDLVLIDEAQDFPEEVFQVAYKICKDPKRMVWAYDEFQTLKDIHIKPPEDLFGKNDKGEPNISSRDLDGVYQGEIKKDYMLQNSYRNPRMVLMTAHGVALGLYSKKGLVDSIDSKREWLALGYDLIQPNAEKIKAGDRVIVERNEIFSKNDLESLLAKKKKEPLKLITSKVFSNDDQQLLEVVSEIGRLVSEQGVNPKEIFVITLNTKRSKEILSDIRSELNGKGIKAIMPGMIEKSSAFKEEGCVTLATPFRAKGNEARVVFVLNCERVILDPGFRGRNSFFVSVTRSQGWCHIYGVGQHMEDLHQEIEAIKADYPRFSYVRPSDGLISRRRNIIAKSDDNIEGVEEAIDKIVDENMDLLLEKLKDRGVFIGGEDVD